MELGAGLEPLPDARLRVRRKSLLDLVHLDATRVVLGPPEQPVDEDLEEVPGEVVGLFGVGPGNLVQGALLACVGSMMVSKCFGGWLKVFFVQPAPENFKHKPIILSSHWNNSINANSNSVCKFWN